MISTLPKALRHPLAAGERALIITGDLDDYELAGGELVYRPAYFLLELFKAGFNLIGLAKSRQPYIYRHRDIPPERKKGLEDYLKTLKLYPLPRGADLDDPQKLRDFLSKLRRLLQAQDKALSFILHLDYLEHFTGSQHPGMETPDQVVMLEFLHSLSISPALKKSNWNAVLCYHYDGPLPPKLKDFYEIELPYPDREQTAGFIRHIAGREGYAALAEGFTEERLGVIMRGLPHKSTERMSRHAAAESRKLEVAAAVRQKGESFIKISNKTLSMMEASVLTSFEQVIGMRVAKRVLQMYADRLASGLAPGRALALIGQPGTCKTVLITLTAQLAGYNCLKLEQTKDKFVGGSEEKIRQALPLIIACAPVILAIDEADKALPNEYQGAADGGVSSDQLAQLQYFLARDDLPKLGVFIMATSNAPQRLGTALQDRFVFLPVLGVIPSEIPDLLRSYVSRLGARTTSEDQALMEEAGRYLYERSASPRQMLDVIRHAINLYGPQLKGSDILAAAADYSGQIDPAGVQAAILQSVRMCSFRSWLPWADNPAYPLPACLEGIVDVKENRVDYEKLDERLSEVMPYAQL